MAVRHKVAVVGGGVSGLSVAHALASGGSGAPPLDITLIEADDRLGGKVFTAELDGLSVDVGPDAILVRNDLVADVLTGIGLAPVARVPARRRAFLWSRNVLGRSRSRLRPLPPFSVFGVPEKLWPLLRNGVLSPWGALRAAADFVLPTSRLPDDPTIGQLLRPRFGDEAVDRFIEPLVGGVHAGRVDDLSARSSAPEVYALASRGGSVYRASRRGSTGRNAPGLRGAGDAATSGESADRPRVPRGMVSFEGGGLSCLVDALTEQLGDARVRTGTSVTRIAVRSGGGYALDIAGTPEDFDAVVLATPAPATARLLEPLAPQAASDLAEISYADVATVTLAFPRRGIDHPLDATGFLVPPAEGRFLLGCTWATSKWAHLDNDRVAVFRCMIGRSDDSRWMEMSDAELTAAAVAELSEALGGLPEASESIVQRWPGAIVQYGPGHAARLDRLDRVLTDLPGLHLTGAAYRGGGLAACLTQGIEAAQRVRDGFAETVEVPA
jgi:oxygen-dependent protoporphyrinogen oxidase